MASIDDGHNSLKVAANTRKVSEAVAAGLSASKQS
jgi:hypothetical protein